MKRLILLIVLAVGGYVAYSRFQAGNPELSFTKGSRYERNGRMVVYGLSNDEGDALCDSLQKQFQQRYSGAVSCIRGRRD